MPYSDDLHEGHNYCPAWGRYRFVGVLTNTQLRIDDADRISTVTEIFVDLVYIFVLQNLLSMQVTSWTQLWHFMVCYAGMFNCWIGKTFYNTRFDVDDYLSRGVTMAEMLCVVGMSSSILMDWSLDHGTSSDDGLARYATFYALIRMLLLFNYCRAYRAQPDLRQLLGLFLLGFSLGVVCFVCAVYISAKEVRLSFLGLGFCFDYGTPFALLPFMVPVHVGHMTERFMCISQLAFAGCVFMFVGNITQQPKAQIWDVLAVGSLALFIIYPLQLLHSRDNGPNATFFGKALAGKFQTYIWLYLHMPLTMAVMVMGNSLATGIEVSTIEFKAADKDWYRGSLCLSVVAFHLLLGVIHYVSAPDGVSFLNKRKRTAMRVIAAVLLTPIFFTEWGAVTTLAYIGAVSIVELIIDALRIDWGMELDETTPEVSEVPMLVSQKTLEQSQLGSLINRMSTELGSPRTASHYGAIGTAVDSTDATKACQ